MYTFKISLGRQKYEKVCTRQMLDQVHISLEVYCF